MIDQIDVYSAGTKPETAVNALSAESLSEVEVDITSAKPKLIDRRTVEDVDVRDDITARVRLLAEQLRPEHPPALHEETVR